MLLSVSVCVRVCLSCLCSNFWKPWPRNFILVWVCSFTISRSRSSGGHVQAHRSIKLDICAFPGGPLSTERQASIVWFLRLFKSYNPNKITFRSNSTSTPFHSCDLDLDLDLMTFTYKLDTLDLQICRRGTGIRINNEVWSFWVKVFKS